jgi:hypothetical protein
MNLRSTSAHAPFSGASHAFGWLDRWPVIALVCLAAIAPLLVVEFPPLVDLYGHLGRYAVQTGLAERPELQPYFSYEWKLIGNLGADLLVQALYPLLGLEASVRWVVILAQALGALGLVLVSREMHGRVTPFALAAIPLLYGYPFNYGFINYALSMALAMLAFVAWRRLQRAGRGGAAQLWLAAVGAAIWVCHTYGWAFLGLLCGSAMLQEVIAERRRPVAAVGRILGACWPLLLPVVPMVIWRAESSGAGLSGWDIQFKKVFLLSPLRAVWSSIDVGSLGVLGVLLGWALVDRGVRFERSLGIAALLCLAFFFILPNKVFGSAFADMRLLPYGIALALVAIAPRPGRSPIGMAMAVLALAFFAGRMAVTGAGYMEQDRVVQATLPALDKLPKGARVAFFVVKPCWVAWRLPELDHLAGVAMARRNAFVNDQWQQPGVNPMVVHYPAAEPYVRDPSHLVTREECTHGQRPKLSYALDRLPRAAFTHVWIVGAYAEPLVVPEGFVRVPYRGMGQLFRVEPPPAPAGPERPAAG